MQKNLTFILDDNVIYIELIQDTNINFEQDIEDKQNIDDIITILQSILYKDIAEYAKKHNEDAKPYNFFNSTHPISISVFTMMDLHFEDMKDLQDYMMKKGYNVVFVNTSEKINRFIKRLF